MNMIIKDIDAMRGLFEVSDYFLVYPRIYYGYTKVTNRFKFLSLRMEDCLRFSVEGYGFFSADWARETETVRAINLHVILIVSRYVTTNIRILNRFL